MRSPIEGNTPRVPKQSSNAFSDSFLQADLDLNEPAAIDDPEGEGPWLVLPAAWMGTFFPEWALITSALLGLGQRPEAVAVYLEALGPSCRRRIGAILHERLLGTRR